MENILAYTAGYIDGDGCFRIRERINGKGSIYFTCEISICSTNKCTLQSFKETIGGNHRLADSNTRFENYKPIYYWWIYGHKSVEFAEKIFPYLVEKRFDSEIFISFKKEKNREIKRYLINKLKTYRQQENYITIDIVNKFKNIQPNIICSIQDYAYFAGFIDAECCFSAYGNTIRLILGSTRPENIEWLMNRFGGYIRFIDRKTKNPKWRDQIWWEIKRHHLYEIIPNILPFLRYKKPVCEKIMQFHETTLSNGGDRTTISFRKKYDQVSIIRKNLLKEIHLLNAKGVNPI